MEYPLISVIVPVYKVEKYLDECVRSIVNQTYRNLEIILVNDGSPDNCPQMCDDWAKRDARIRVIHKENGGVSSARNAGLDVCGGEYVAFVDSDDWLEPDMYETMLRYVKKDVIVICNYLVHRSGGVSAGYKAELGKQIISFKREQFVDFHFMVVTGSPVNKLYLKKYCISIRFLKDISLGEDLLFNLEYFKRSKADILLLTDGLYHVRREEENTLSTKYRPDRYDCFLLLHNAVLRYCKDELHLEADEMKKLHFINMQESLVILEMFDDSDHKEDIRKILSHPEFRKQLIDGRMAWVGRFLLTHGQYRIYRTLMQMKNRLLRR